MNFKELLKKSNMNMREFSKYFEIPYRTVQNWKAGTNQCPDYILNLMQYKLKNENIMEDKKMLKNNYDKEFEIEGFKEARRYFVEGEEKAFAEFDKDEFLGDDLDDYIETWKNYIDELKSCGSMEELASVLNANSDAFGDGSEYIVK